MFWNFRYRRRNVSQDYRSGSYVWWDRVSERWKSIIKTACNKMGGRFDKIHPVYQKMILVVFFLAGTTMFVFFAVGGGSARRGLLHKVTPITQPAHAIQHYDTAGLKSGGNIQSIQQYRFFLDSLSTTPKGRQVLDSVQASRPGLIDSLTLIEKIIGLH